MQFYMHQYLTKDQPLCKGETNKSRWCFEKNEKIQKMYRSYRDANITDGAFIENVMREYISVKSEATEI